MEDRIKIDITGGVADVRMVRVDKMNALDDPMFEALVSTIDKLKADKSVRVVVLSGEGRAFCAGLDAGNFGKMASGEGRYSEAGGKKSAEDAAFASRTHGPANRAQYAVWGWRDLPVPVIAAVHGFAFGGGFQLTLGADMRYVTPDAKLSIMEIKWGLVPDMAGTQLMRHIVREDIVRELTYTGRIFSGEEAGKFGFATRVVADPREEALAVAREIAGKNPDAIRAVKRIYNAAVYDDAKTGLMAESVEQIKLIGSKNQVEAVMANMQKRDPVFQD